MKTNGEPGARHEEPQDALGPWPSLPLDEWKDTYATLHMWLQIVGKIALAQAPPLNHCWGSALHLTGRGLTTPVLPYDRRAFAIEFDFIDHRVIVSTTDGDQSVSPLRPQSVAAFYAEMMATLAAMRLPVRIWPVPVEIPTPIPFEQDTQHASYDAAYANRFWRILIQSHRVFSKARSLFIGKSSPVHFFWGSCDLAVTRFSGRPAPPREGPAFMRDAYSHEVISHGFWPGSGPIHEPAFYAYAVPEPSGLKDAPILPQGAYYHAELSEFILPYQVLQTADSADDALLAFIDSTYQAASTRAHWDPALSR